MIASLSFAETLSGKDFHGRLETSADSPLVAFNTIDCRRPSQSETDLMSCRDSKT